MKLLIYTTFLLFPVLNQLVYAQTDQLISTGNIFDGEPYMAINPNNKQHIVIGWMGFELNQNVVIKTAVTFNGGQTWSTPTWFAHEVAGNYSADISLNFDKQGRLYASYIDYDRDNFNNGKVVVRKSLNGGVSFGAAVTAINITACPQKLCIDRPWMIVDQSNGPNSGAIYITTVNANNSTLVSAPYHPYFVSSTDNGQSFSALRELDTLNFLAGSIIIQPMASPDIDANGVFKAMYPSYKPDTQGPFAHYFIASSINGGANIDQFNALNSTGSSMNNTLVKRGPLFRIDPTDPLHMVYFTLKENNADVDVVFIESFNGGTTWSNEIRVNQDNIGNGVLHDLTWADFDDDGDLVICWRDRRNASGTGYNQPSEIYGIIKKKNSSSFSNEFKVSGTTAAHDAILEANGNDFMHVQYTQDTIYATWGDVRSGKLKIYFSRMSESNLTADINEISTETLIFPVPVKALHLLQLPDHWLGSEISIYDESGKLHYQEKVVSSSFETSRLKTGTYIIRCNSETQRFIISD